VPPHSKIDFCVVALHGYGATLYTPGTPLITPPAIERFWSAVARHRFYRGRHDAPVGLRRSRILFMLQPYFSTALWQEHQFSACVISGTRLCLHMEWRKGKPGEREGLDRGNGKSGSLLTLPSSAKQTQQAKSHEDKG